MIDRDGYRLNVGIILSNTRNQVFWGKRVREDAWQFPQGGMKRGETPEQAMYRELEEEVGLHGCHVRILGRTREWLRYDVPEQWTRRDARGIYRGQKQIWFLLRLTGRDCDVRLRANERPEFDAWRWSDYWVPMDLVVTFKRDVYQRALAELARYLPRMGPPRPAPLCDPGLVVGLPSATAPEGLSGALSPGALPALQGGMPSASTPAALTVGTSGACLPSALTTALIPTRAAAATTVVQQERTRAA